MSIKNNTASLQQLLEVVNNLPDAGSGGIELPELTNPANTDEIFLNKEVIDENGKVKTGTFTIDNEINTQEDLLSELRAALNGKAGGGEQVAPEISVNASGLITATAGTKSSTYQMAFQPAKTITPSITSQIAVLSGHYTGGNITVAAVPTQTKSVTPTSVTQNITPDSGKFLSKVTVNAIPSTYVIPSGTLTIRENGTHDVKNYASATVEIAGGSGEQAEWSANEDAMVSRTITSYTNDRVKSIGGYAFEHCKSLTSVNFPVCTSISDHAFAFCSNLTTVNFPVCTSIYWSVFKRCSNLTTVNFPVCIWIDFYAFHDCYRLSSLTLGASTVCNLTDSWAFSSTPFAGYSSYFSGTPHIYVPASLVSAYKSATNWTYFSSYITAIPSDY